MSSNWNLRLIGALWFSSIAAAFAWIYAHTGIPESTGISNGKYTFAIEIFMCTFPCGYLLGHKIISHNNSCEIKLRKAALLGIAVVFLSSINFSVYEAISAHNLDQTRKIVYATLGYLVFETLSAATNNPVLEKINDDYPRDINGNPEGI